MKGKIKTQSFPGYSVDIVNITTTIMHIEMTGKIDDTNLKN